MLFSGNLIKLNTQYLVPVKYTLESCNQTVIINDLIGKKIKISFNGTINCIHCGRKTRKSYGQGYCFSCFQTVPQASPAIVRPELDQSHLGISRDMEWSKKNSLVDHYVYLAVSSSLKVGITRFTQIPTRWIDQGASKAIRIAKVPYRQLSGLLEVELKKNFADKTNWRKMLSNSIDGNINLLDERDKAHKSLTKANFSEYLIDDQITEITYPISKYPQKINSISLDKISEIEAKLEGIKGQYLIFEGGQVFNIRKHNGYFVDISIIE